MQPKAIIFDFDGTLADTLPICYYSFQKVFKQFDDRELSAEEIKLMFGPSETGIIRHNLLDDNKEEAIELYYACYLEEHARLVQPNEEILQLLHDLKDQQYKLGIFTGKAKRSLDISLQQLNMENIFDVLITGDDVEEPKPHPEGLLKALHILKINNKEAVFVGDSDADILAGRQSSVYTIGVQWLDRNICFQTKPDTTLNNVSDLYLLLKEINHG